TSVGVAPSSPESAFLGGIPVRERWEVPLNRAEVARRAGRPRTGVSKCELRGHRVDCREARRVDAVLGRGWISWRLGWKGESRPPRATARARLSRGTVAGRQRVRGR